MRNDITDDPGVAGGRLIASYVRWHQTIHEFSHMQEIVPCLLHVVTGSRHPSLCAKQFFIGVFLALQHNAHLLYLPVLPGCQ